MHYKMKVVIADPETKEGMNSDMLFILDAEFFYDEKDYGNGHYLAIRTSNRIPFENYYDIRYDTEFRSDKKEEYLIAWANKYWSGKNGAWKVKSIEVTEE